MSSLLTILMFVILFACVATTYAEGIWSNAIRLINVVTAALLATNFFEPVARWLDGWVGSWSLSGLQGTAACDFLALWGLFGLFMLILRAPTDYLSKVQVKFLKIADQIGSGVLSLWIGWVLVCFTMMTLHTAPLAQTFLFGGFNAEDSMVVGLAPDRQWLGFVQKVSGGQFSRAATPQEQQNGIYGKPAPEDKDKYDADGKLCVFDRRAEFMPKYAARRVSLQVNMVKNSAHP
jgi:hypothetical protein